MKVIQVNGIIFDSNRESPGSGATLLSAPFLKKSTRDKSSRFYLVAEDTSAEDMNEQLVNVNARKGTMSTILLL